MDIRIGNDIRMDVSIKEIGGYSAEDIIKTVGRFVPIINTPNKKPFPESNCSSEYTVHGCGLPKYNVFPNKGHHCILQHQSHGLCVYEDENSPAKLSFDKKYIYSYFPAKNQKHEGPYNFILEVWVKDENWDEGVRQYTIQCGNLFNLTPLGSSGSLTITVTRVSTPDLYVSTLSDKQISTINKNYIQLMINSVSYSLNSLPYSGIPIKLDDNDRVVIISKYDTIRVSYNGFLFPMYILKVSDSCYLYISSYTYTANEIYLTILNGDSPIYNITESGEDGPTHEDPTPEQPDLPDQPGGDDTPGLSASRVENNTLYTVGSKIGSTILLSGSINKNTLIL